MLHIEDWGMIDYQDAVEKQLFFFNKSIENKMSGIENNQNLFILEHKPVYTLGKNGKIEHLLPIAKSSCASFYETSRGGDITFHGPGQLVIYPIFDLNQLKMGLAAYVSTLETIGIEVCKHYGIEASTIDGENGVWLDVGTPKVRKIMAIGIKASRFITMHGLAFNVNTDLKFFEYMIPCGIKDKGVTSLEKELGRKIDLNEVKGLFIEKFKGVVNSD